MMKPTIVHLVDDTTAGGVMRVLEHLTASKPLAQNASHQILSVSRTGLALPRIDPDVIVSHLSINWRRLPWFVALRARFAHTPMIHVEHSYTEAFVTEQTPRPARLKGLLTTVYSLFERVVTVSEAQALWMSRDRLVDRNCLACIPSAVEIRDFLDIPMANGTPRVIGAIGRLEPQKGFDILIQALRARPDLDLAVHIYGDGGERPHLEELAEGDRRIVFKGHCDPVVAMHSVDVVAMPSRWEAYGLVALEARASGRPLLVTRVDGLGDHIGEGAIAVGRTVADWTGALATLPSAVDRQQLEYARRCATTAGVRFEDGWDRLIEAVIGRTGKLAA